MSQTSQLLVLIMHEDILLTERKSLAGIGFEVNKGGPVIIAVHTGENQYQVKRLPEDFMFYEKFIDKLISQDDLVLIAQLIKRNNSIKTMSLCCHANLTNAQENCITSQTHQITQRLKPNRLMLISTTNPHCFDDSGVYAAGRPTSSDFTLPLEVKAAVVLLRNDIITQINKELEKPTWIQSRTRAYAAQYYFSCFFSRRSPRVGLDPLNDDDRADECLFNISQHPDNSTRVC